MRGAWFAARHRRRLAQAVTVARAAHDEKTRSKARGLARSAGVAKHRVWRARSVSQALFDQETIASLTEVLANVAATLQAAEQHRLKRRRRKRMRRYILGVTVIGGAAFGVWRRGMREPAASADVDAAAR